MIDKKNTKKAHLPEEFFHELEALLKEQHDNKLKETLDSYFDGTIKKVEDLNLK